MNYPETCGRAVLLCSSEGSENPEAGSGPAASFQRGGMSQPGIGPGRAGTELGDCGERPPEESRWAGKGAGESWADG